MNMNERIFDFHRSVGAGNFRRVKEFYEKNERYGKNHEQDTIGRRCCKGNKP